MVSHPSLNCHQLRDNQSEGSASTSLAWDPRAPLRTQASPVRAVREGGASRRRCRLPEGGEGLPRVRTQPRSPSSGPSSPAQAPVFG